MIFFSILFVLLYSVSPSPIVKILEQSQHEQDQFFIPLDHCVLTPKLGDSGTKKFLEECEGIGKFNEAGRQDSDDSYLQPGSPQFPNLSLMNSAPSVSTP